MNRLLFVIIAISFVCGTSSCKLWRRVTGKQKARVADTALASAPLDSGLLRTDTSITRERTPVLRAEDSAMMALVRTALPLWNARTEFTTFSGRAKVDYEGGGESHEFTASIRIERDKRIWISVTALLGIEIVRTLITPDTIIAINRLQKYVHVLPFADANQLLPVPADFITLQSLIIGDVLPAGHPLSLVKDTGELIVLSASGPDYAQQVAFARKDTTISAQTLAGENALLQAAYYGYELINGRRFAAGRELNMADKSGGHRLRLEFSKVTFDEPVEMNISIPERYERR